MTHQSIRIEDIFEIIFNCLEFHQILTADQKSFANIKKWLREIDASAGASVQKLLVGNKSELVNERTISTEVGKSLAGSLNIRFVETSAKSSTNVEEVFLLMANDVLENVASTKA